MFLVRGLPPEILGKFDEKTVVGNGLLIKDPSTYTTLQKSCKVDLTIEEYDPNARHNVRRSIVSHKAAAFVDPKSR